MPTRRETNFDADKFLDSYEDRTASAMRDPATVKEPPKTTAKASETPATASPKEVEYMEKYLLPQKYVRVIKSGKQVAVSDEFKVKIQKLLLFFSDGGTIAGYVNNVLEQHFREFDDVIQRMFNKTKQI